MGAEIIKIEPPGVGESLRRAESSPGGVGYSFLMLNANKRSVTLNLKHPRGREIILKLIERADVLVENYSAGVMESFRARLRGLARPLPAPGLCERQGLRERRSVGAPGRDGLHGAGELGLHERDRLSRSQRGENARHLHRHGHWQPSRKRHPGRAAAARAQRARAKGRGRDARRVRPGNDRPYRRPTAGAQAGASRQSPSQCLSLRRLSRRRRRDSDFLPHRIALARAGEADGARGVDRRSAFQESRDATCQRR